MKNLVLMAAIAALLVSGCKKDEAQSTGGTGASTTGSSTTTSDKPVDGASATKDMIVGSWSATNEEDSDGMKMSGTMHVDYSADGSYLAKMDGNFTGENQGIAMSGDIKFEQKGKWSFDKGEIKMTPDKDGTTGGVENFKCSATDPKMADAIKGKEAEMQKQFDSAMKGNFEKENTEKVKSVSGSEMVTTTSAGKDVTWKKG